MSRPFHGIDYPLSPSFVYCYRLLSHHVTALLQSPYDIVVVGSVNSSHDYYVRLRFIDHPLEVMGKVHWDFFSPQL